MRVASSNRPVRTLVLALAAPLIVGCGDEPLAPSEVADTYVLLSINGDPLPAPAGYQGPADEGIIVIADTLRLAADGTGSLVRVLEMGFVQLDSEGQRSRIETPLHFETTSGGVAITFDCPPNALAVCLAGPHLTARRTATGLVATQSMGSQPVELVYSSVQRLD